MHTPTKSQVQTVIDTLKKSLILHPETENLNMANPNICDTTLCHGGHYVIGKDIRGENIDFSDGANAMAKDLGFTSKEHLVEWAHNTFSIWQPFERTEGNDFFYMFSNPLAFFHPTKRPNGATTLQHIIDHWTEVKSRLKN